MLVLKPWRTKAIEVTTYLLESSRVVSHGKHERTYHCFYDAEPQRVLGGLQPQELCFLTFLRRTEALQHPRAFYCGSLWEQHPIALCGELPKTMLPFWEPAES